MIQIESVGDEKSMLTWVFSRDAHRIYKIAAEICKNPFCRCSEIALRFLDMSMGSNAAFIVQVDILSQKRIKAKTQFDAAQEELAQDFVDEVSEADWLKLYQMFYAVKASNIETYDYENKIYGTLPIDIADTQRSNALLAYGEIFPYSPPIFLNIGDAVYLLDEQFCPKRDCPCTHDSLGISSVKEGVTIGNAQIFDLNYKTGSLEALSEPPADFPSAEEILQALHKNPETSFEKIKKRHLRIKLVYKKYKMQSLWTDGASILTVVGCGKVGRNELCPCGSGKKYKYCCA